MRKGNGKGNAAKHFIDVDACVVKRLGGLRITLAGRNLRAGQTGRWDRDHLESLQFHRLRGTIGDPDETAGNGRTA